MMPMTENFLTHGLSALTLAFMLTSCNSQPTAVVREPQNNTGPSSKPSSGPSGEPSVVNAPVVQPSAPSQPSGPIDLSACIAPKYQLPEVYRECTTDADCTVIQHTRNCCSASKISGVAKKHFAQARACAEKFPPGYCDCVAGPTVADDNNIAPSVSMTLVECVTVDSGQKQCRSRLK